MKSKKTPRKPVPIPSKKEGAEESLPPPAAASNRRSWYIALLAVGAVILIGATVAAMTTGLSEWERRAFNFINHAYLPTWVAEQIAKPISNAVWGMVFLVAALLAIPKFRLLAWQYGVAAGSAYAGAFILEHLVDRARPIGLASYEVVARAAQDGPGFPSGHVAVLTALVLTIWPWVSWPWRFLMIVFVGIEAWARIFLGVHAPLDVVGAVGVSMVVVGVIHLLPAKMKSFFKLST